MSITLWRCAVTEGKSVAAPGPVQGLVQERVLSEPAAGRQEHSMDRFACSLSHTARRQLQHACHTRTILSAHAALPFTPVEAYSRALNTPVSSWNTPRYGARGSFRSNGSMPRKGRLTQ